MKVLHVAPAFYPATYWGGPTISVLGLCRSLARAGTKLQVLTTDTAGPARSQSVLVESFPMRYEPGYEVFFCHRWFGADIAPGLLLRLAKMIREADVVHLTGVFSFPTIPTLFVCFLMGKPVVWSPRGALQKWDIATRPRMKRIYERACDMLVSRKRCLLHVTSEREAADSLARITNSEVAIIPNGVDIPAAQPDRSWRPNGSLRLLFLGRLHPIKGLENLFHALEKIKDGTISLTVCGDGDMPYTESLRRLASALNLNDSVRFLGRVEGAEKTNAFLLADVCVVPSFTENFGMVVAEALASGVPVIVSRGAPWADVEAQGCGLWTENTPDSLAAAILRIRSMGLPGMGAEGRRWMEASFSWNDVGRKMLEIYEDALRRAR